MNRRLGILAGAAFALAGFGIVAFQVALDVSPAARATTAPVVSQVTQASYAASSSTVPKSCAPRPGLPASAAATAAAASVTAAGHPLKDLSIQPALLTVPQWTSLLNLAKTAGVDVVDLGVSWSSNQPNGPAPANEFASLQQFVAAARARGMQLRFQLYGFPQWAHDAGEPSATAEPWLAPEHPDKLAAWSGFVTRVVKAFGTSVSYYEIWNEENLPMFWDQGPNPVEYSDLLECSYTAAKVANPAVTIVSGGLSQNDVGFLTKLYAALDRFPYAQADNHFFDVLGVHPYSGGRGPSVNLPQYVEAGPWGPIDTNFLGFTALHSLMAAQGDPQKKIYIGEYGWPVSGYAEAISDGPNTISEAQRAAWLPQAFQDAAQTNEVIGMSWYTFYPTPYDLPAWALVRNADGSINGTTHWVTTPSFQAFARVP